MLNDETLKHETGGSRLRLCTSAGEGLPPTVGDAWTARLHGKSAFRVRAVIPRVGYLAVAAHSRFGQLAVVGVLVGAGLWMGAAALWPRRPEADDAVPTPTAIG